MSFITETHSLGKFELMNSYFTDAQSVQYSGSQVCDLAAGLFRQRSPKRDHFCKRVPFYWRDICQEWRFLDDADNFSKSER